MDFTGPLCPSYIWITFWDLKSYNLIFLSWEHEARKFPKEWNLTLWMTPLCSLYVWIGFFVFRSHKYTNLSSQEAILHAVGENSQCLTQLSCFLRVYWSLLSIVDQTFISLSSPHEANSKASHEKLRPLILALWALIRVVYFDEGWKSTSQNFKLSSLEAETRMLPLGENFISWIWLLIFGLSYFMTDKFLWCGFFVKIP